MCVCFPACNGTSEQDSTCRVFESVCHKHGLYPEQDILGHKHVLLRQSGLSEDKNHDGDAGPFDYSTIHLVCDV